MKTVEINLKMTKDYEEKPARGLLCLKRAYEAARKALSLLWLRNYRLTQKFLQH